MTLAELITEYMQHTGKTAITRQDAYELAWCWKQVKLEAAAAIPDAELDRLLFGRPADEVRA